jgi:hypothetical protein
MFRALVGWLLLAVVPHSALATVPGAVFGARGLKVVALHVRLWGDTPKSVRDTVQPVLAQLLTDAGATVLLPGDPEFNTAKAQLIIELKTYKSADSTACAWGVDIGLYDPVQLVRDPSIQPSRAFSYYNWRMGIAGCDSVQAVLRSEAVEFFGQFAGAYKHENAR